MSVKLFNTMSRQLEDFGSITPNQVKMYCCGPTVYNFAHIGNLRTYLFEDLLKRTLISNGYDVKHVMNITDVGHLTGDSDDGEDKMAKRSRETGKSVYEIAQFYTDAFFSDEEKLNIIRPSIVCKATDNITEMIEMIKKLEEEGHTYIAGGNVYFSIDSIDDYGKLARLKLDDLRSGARIDVDSNKKNPKDFALWFTNSKFKNQAMTWDSPWGVGYPGWHIECSAMSMRYLGNHFDIHCGGIDAIPVHHTNEIAQSEAACGHKPWVNYWCHGEFLINDNGKMSKSSGEFLTLTVLENKGYNPLVYRYFCLSGHYRTQLKFSYEALDHSKVAFNSLISTVRRLKESCQASVTPKENAMSYYNAFIAAMNNDLNTPQAMAQLWSLISDNEVTDSDKLAVLYKMDDILGLKLKEVEMEAAVPEEIQALSMQRIELKKAKDYAGADAIRQKILDLGYDLKDTPKGPIITKRM